MSAGVTLVTLMVYKFCNFPIALPHFRESSSICEGWAALHQPSNNFHVCMLVSSFPESWRKQVSHSIS